MKSLLWIASVLVALGVLAEGAFATILVDFTREAGYAAGDGTPGLWAYYGHPNPEDSGWNLAKDARGGTWNLVGTAGETATLTEGSATGWWIGDNGSMSPPTPSETGVPIPLATARIGRFFDFEETVTYSFSGLDADEQYNFTVYASASEPIYGSSWEGGGGSVTLASTAVDIRNIGSEAGAIGTFVATTDSSGSLVLTASSEPSNHAVLVNAMILSVVPEPSSLGLLGLGTMMFIRRRTRR